MKPFAIVALAAAYLANAFNSIFSKRKPHNIITQPDYLRRRSYKKSKGGGNGKGFMTQFALPRSKDYLPTYRGPGYEKYLHSN